MDARDVERLVELSLDGELDPAEEAELSRVQLSPEARTAAARAKHFHVHLRDKLRAATDDTLTPPSLRARISYRLQREVDVERDRVFPWGRAVAATLAVTVLVLASWSDASSAFDVEERSRCTAATRHRKCGPRGLASVERSSTTTSATPVRMPPPSRASSPGCLGARLAVMDSHDMAYLMYDRRGARVSLFAVPKQARFRPPSTFRPATFRGRPVVVGQHRGYNVVSYADDRVTYWLVGNLDTDELMAFVPEDPSN
ncbi:MAG: hypothetical protein HC923_09520 [Myxococcales bacterium]|nr:hypothetical protein [Myxococcales bacterium]